MGNVYAVTGFIDVTGCIDGCIYTLVLVWLMLAHVDVLMAKIHPFVGVSHVTDCIDCLVTPWCWCVRCQ